MRGNKYRVTVSLRLVQSIIYHRWNMTGFFDFSSKLQQQPCSGDMIGQGDTIYYERWWVLINCSNLIRNDDKRQAACIRNIWYGTEVMNKRGTRTHFFPSTSQYPGPSKDLLNKQQLHLLLAANSPTFVVHRIYIGKISKIGDSLPIIQSNNLSPAVTLDLGSGGTNTNK